MEDCAMGSCNAAAGKCDAISSSGAIPCNSIIGHDWTCIECHESKGKACTAQAGYLTSDRVNGVCNDAYGCVSPSRERAVGGDCDHINEENKSLACTPYYSKIK